MRGLSVPRYEIYETGAGGRGSVLPKLIGILVAVSLLRMVARHRHGGGGSWRDRRRDVIAEIHRELHAQEDLKADTDASAPAPGTTKA
jgi:hypothetical protein